MDRRALLKEAQSASTSPARLAELAAHESADIRRVAARNPSLDDASLLRLLDDPVWEVRTVAAHHGRTPRDKAIQTMTALATSETAAQRAVAARSPLTPLELLERLATDPDPETRSNTAKNVRTAPMVARGLLTDNEPCVVLGALAHPSVTHDERRAFLTANFLLRFFEAHADGDHLFEALCERYLWDVLERAFPDPERFDDVWQELVRAHFELVEIPSREAVLAAVHRQHWPAIARRLATEVGGGVPQAS